MYKQSKYNFLVQNKQGDYLLYNSLKGIKSFYKIKRNNSSILQYLTDYHIVKDNNVITDWLFHMGFLVLADYNEDIELKRLYIDTITNQKLNLIISPTEQCNLRCTYCCEQFKSGKMSETTQQALISFIEKNISRSAGLNVDWFGGEPLIALDVIENLSSHFMQICKDKRKNYTAFITTNGTLLDLKTFESLYKKHVFTYQITIDGIQKIHDRQRITIDGKPTYNQIINNLISIKKSTIGKYATILLLTNYSSVLSNQLYEYKKHLHELFSDDKRFVFACARIMDLGGSQIHNYRSKIVNDEGMNRLYNKLVDIDEYKLSYTYSKFLDPGSLVCYAAKEHSFVIGSDGRVYKCEHIFQTNKEDSVGHLESNGNMVLNKSKTDNWLGHFDYCKNDKCRLKPLCMGEDCLKKRINSHNVQHGNSCEFALCHFEKKTIENILLLLDHECDKFIIFDDALLTRQAAQ